MRFRFDLAPWMASAALFLAFACSSRASAGLLYDNGPIDNTITAYAVSTNGSTYGWAVSDSFTLASSANLVSVRAGIVAAPGDTPVTIDWSIGTTPMGTDVSSGTSLLSNTFFGYSVYASGGYATFDSTFSVDGTVGAGTYWLTLQRGTTANNNFVAWDANGGPSTAYQRDTFHSGNPYQVDSESFQIYGEAGSVPEPASLAIWAVGALSCVAASYRCRRSDWANSNNSRTKGHL